MQRQGKTFLTLHTALFTLHTPHFISSQIMWVLLISPHLSSSHLIPPPLTCYLRKFFSTVFIPSAHWSTFLISSNLFSAHLSCSARQKALPVRTQKLETQMHLHFTQEKPLESIFVLQSLARLPSSSVSQKSFVNTQSSRANCTPRPCQARVWLKTGGGGVRRGKRRGGGSARQGAKISKIGAQI